MNKATIKLSIKAVDDSERLIEGWATKPEEDRCGDVVMPKGVIYDLPLPFLLDHDTRKNVGEVERVEVTDKGIKFWARIKKIAEPGEVQDLCNEAWELVRNGLRKKVSIGFRALEWEVLPNNGLQIKAWEWLELSAVTVPCLPSASITSVKGLGVNNAFVTVTGADRGGSIKLVRAPGHRIIRDGSVKLKSATS